MNRVIFPEIKGKRINIVFTASTGHVFSLIVPEKNIKMGQIFREYAQKVNISPNLIGNGIHFLFNGRKFNKEDDDKMIEDFGFLDGSNVLVVDTKNFIGAYRKYKKI